MYSTASENPSMNGKFPDNIEHEFELTLTRRAFKILFFGQAKKKVKISLGMMYQLTNFSRFHPGLGQWSQEMGHFLAVCKENDNHNIHCKKIHSMPTDYQCFAKLPLNLSSSIKWLYTIWRRECIQRWHPDFKPVMDILAEEDCFTHI